MANNAQAMFVAVDRELYEELPVRRARQHLIDVDIVKAATSSEDALNHLSDCQAVFEIHVGEMEGAVEGFVQQDMLFTPDLDTEKRPLHYLAFVGLYMYHRRDEYLKGETFKENSPFGHFLDRVEVATSMILKEYELAWRGDYRMTLEKQVDFCKRIGELHRRMAWLICGDFSLGVENEQQLLHQGFSILAAAHSAPYIPRNKQLSLESVDFDEYGGDAAAHDEYLETWEDETFGVYDVDQRQKGREGIAFRANGRAYSEARFGVTQSRSSSETIS